jgi:uncharacterized membrane protein YedE/YeeE
VLFLQVLFQTPPRRLAALRRAAPFLGVEVLEDALVLQIVAVDGLVVGVFIVLFGVGLLVHVPRAVTKLGSERRRYNSGAEDLQGSDR